MSTRPKKQKVKLAKRRTIRRHTPISPTKFALLKAMEIDFNTIPDYLSKTNQAFEKKIHSILPSTINVEDLRKVAMLMYKIICLDLVHSLWIVYRKSGTGDLSSTLAIHQVDKKIWPIEVQTSMKLSKVQRHTDEDNPCLTFVNHYLHQFNDQSKQYRTQLNAKTSRLVGYTRSLEHIIEKFVQQGLISKRIEIDREIALVQYHYTDVLLKRAFLTQNPNENQVKLFQYIFLFLFFLT